jgi:hypothetical protein
MAIKDRFTTRSASWVGATLMVKADIILNKDTFVVGAAMVKAVAHFLQ